MALTSQYRSPDDRTFHQVRSFPFPFLDAGFLQLVNAYIGQYSLLLVSKAYILLLIKIYYRAIGLDVFEQMPIRGNPSGAGYHGNDRRLRAGNACRQYQQNGGVSSAAQVGYIFMGMGIGGIAGYTADDFPYHGTCGDQVHALFDHTPPCGSLGQQSLI